MPAKAKLVTRQATTTSVTADNLNKGSALEFAELDGNLINLRDQTFGVVGDDSATIDIAAGGTLYIQGGTNVTTATNSDGTITINSSAASDVFKTISVAGQSDVVADANTDTLTLAAGSGMTITTNAGSDTITFASSGGASLGDLTVVGSTLSSPSNADFTINSSGTGNVIIEKLIIRDGPSSANSITTESGYGLNLTATNGNMSLSANAISMSSSLHVGLGGVDSGGILIEDNTIKTARSNENLEIAPAGSGSLHVQTSLKLASGATVTGIDNGALGSSATLLATQGAIKTYVDSQVTTAGQGWRVFGDDSSGVDIVEGGSLYIRGGDNVTTSTNSDGTITITASDSTLSLIDEDNMSTNSATRPPSQQSVKAYADTKATLSGSTNNTIATVTGAHALNGEANLTFDGSTLAVTGAATVSTTLGVTGASTLDGVLISDNHISSAASNADLHIDTSGTGKVITNAVQVGVGDQTGGNIILTDQADGSFQTAQYANPGMLNPSGLQVDSAGSYHYSQLILNNFSTNAYNSLWATRSRSNTHGTNAYLESGDVIFNFFGAGWNGDTDGSGYFSGNTIVDLFASENHDVSNRGGGFRVKTINTGATSGATTKLEITDNVVIQNPKAATTAALSVEGSIRLKNTSNPSNVTDSAHIFAKDDGSTSEVYVRDEAGNETKISPHNQSGQWEYYSKNINTGKVFRVNMEKMIRKLEDITGETFIESV